MNRLNLQYSNNFLTENVAYQLWSKEIKSQFYSGNKCTIQLI